MIAKSTVRTYAAPSDLREVALLLRHAWGGILLCALLCVAAAEAYLRTARPVYASRALLEVDQDAGSSNGDDDSAETLRTLQLKLADQAVLLAVIRANGLATDPDFAPPGGASDAELVRLLNAKISVDLLRGSRLIAVTVEDHDPAKAQRLAQSVIGQFFRQSAAAERGDDLSSRDRLLAEAQRLGAAVTVAEDRLQAYREKYHAVSLEDRQDIVVERLRELDQEVAAAKNTRLAMEADQERIRRLAGSAPEQLLNIRGIAAQPEVIDLRKAVTDQEAQVATLAMRYGPLHPTMIQARSELADLRASLDAAVRKAGGLLQQSYDAARATESALEAALAQQEQAALALDGIAIPYRALERAVQADVATYQQVLDKLNETDANRGLLSKYDVDGSRIHVVEQPLTPVRPVRPVASLWLAGAVAAGLVLGGGSALAARALNDTVSSVDGAEIFLDLPVLTTVPKSPHDRLTSGPVVLKRPATTEAEAFRSLRTAISLRAPGEEQRCVLFTSAVPGEGKSYCSLNYAAALAQQGRRTLLIDGDLRRPQQLSADSGRSLLQRMLTGRSAKPGISECVRQPELFAQTVQATTVPNLFLLGDAKGRVTAAELLAQDGLKEILRRALAAFERVVVDSAPVLAVSDTLHIARNVPTLCLVIRAGRTPRRLVARACQLLTDAAQHAPAGVILNKIGRGPAAGYHYYYSDKAYA